MIYRLIIATLLAMSSISMALLGVDAIKSGDAVPDFIVGNAECNGVLISPRVVLSSAGCKKVGEGSRTGFYHRRTGEFVEGTAYDHPEYGAKNSHYHRDKYFHDIAVVILDKQFSGSVRHYARIPSYKQESRLMVSEVTKLHLYGYSSFDYVKQASYQDSYVSRETKEKIKNKFFRYISIMKYRRLNPSRLCTDCVPNNEQLFSDEFIRYVYDDLHMKDRDLDRMFILIAEAYGQQDMLNPITHEDRGGAITCLDEVKGGLQLLGIMSGTKVHTRLKEYWPWIVNTVKKRSINNALYIAKYVIDARQLYDGVLDHGIASNAKVGDLFLYHDIAKEEIEYFRLVKNGENIQFSPNNKAGNDYLEYLGIKLPAYNPTIIKNWTIDNLVNISMGDIFVAKSSGNHVRYFRFIGNPSDFNKIYFLHLQRYWILFKDDKVNTYFRFPIMDKTNNRWWQYLGDKLPKYNPTVIKLWKHNTAEKSLGSIYVHENLFNRDVEYFRFIGPSYRNYERLPVDKGNSLFWQYLGTELPDYNPTILHKWHKNDGAGRIGDIYVVYSRNTREVRYFRITANTNHRDYGYYPEDKQPRRVWWEDMGTNIPNEQTLRF